MYSSSLCNELKLEEREAFHLKELLQKEICNPYHCKTIDGKIALSRIFEKVWPKKDASSQNENHHLSS